MVEIKSQKGNKAEVICGDGARRHGKRKPNSGGIWANSRERESLLSRGVPEVWDSALFKLEFEGY